MDFWKTLLLAVSCMTCLALPSPSGGTIAAVPAADHHHKATASAATATAAISGARRKRQSSAEDPLQSVATGDDAEVDEPRKRFKVVRNSNGTLSIVVLDTQSTTTKTIHTADDDTEPPPTLEHDDDLLASPGKASSKRRARRATSPDISFPNDTDIRPTFVPTKCANGLTFCEEVPNYPLELIEAVISRDGHRFSELFGRDILSEDPSLANRFSGINESTMCESMRQVIYPKTGMTKENAWLYIVNSDKFQQGVLVEQCTKPDEPCNYTKSFPRGYQTRCKQMYIYRQLVSINGEGVTEKNMFQIPSCCQCVVTEA